MFAKSSLLLLSATFFGCSASTISDSAEKNNFKKDIQVQDARLDNPDAQQLKILQSAIAPFMNGQIIPLSESVFTQSSELVIGARRLNRQGQAINDKDIQLPTQGSGDRFFLKLQADKCYLLHEQSGSFVELRGLSCISAP